MDADEALAALFNECVIAFVPSNSLPPRTISEYARVVEDNGATVLEPRRDGTLSIAKVTHIVSNTIDFPQYEESQAFMIPVVTAQWITTSIHRRKQGQVRPFSPDPRMVFSEVVVTCADLPLMDKESIIGAVMALGGQESKDATRLTTHLCALSTDHPKVQAALAGKWKGKVVLPHWFDDCFKLGKRIDEGPYMLPDPEILRMLPEDDVRIPENKHIAGATSAMPMSLDWPPLPSNADAARPPVTIFQDRIVMLSNDLNITTRLSKAIQDIIVHGGGKTTDEVDDCDVFVCNYRFGDDYLEAARSCKDIGSLSWLYHLIIHNEWTLPRRRLLHYPIPKTPIPGFEGLRITVSNYGGEARIYLENLIKACGAEYTKTMKADNTHLITARNTSDKCKAAPEWGIAVINHLWIEESYAKCEMKPVNVKKYNHFPLRTNLGEIIGQTFLDESRLKELHYPGSPRSNSPSAKRKRKILEAAEENTYNHGPAQGLIMGREKDFDVRRDNGRDVTSKREISNSTEATTPAPSRHVRAGKENDTPSVASTGGRSAKAKARDMLFNIADDIALYEKEKKRRSKGATAPWGGKRAADLAEKEKAADHSSPASKLRHEDEDSSKRPAKKSRPSLPEVQMRIILTGFSRWVNDKNKEDHDRRKLRDLGIQIVQEGQPCDFLAAPHIVRTVKFLCALARGPTVISSNFIDAVLQSGKVPDVEDFLLQDTETEARYSVKLERSVARAKANRGKLLAGVPIYCTDQIRNGHGSYQSIAEANGALFMVYRARSGTTIKPTTAEEDGNAPPEPVYLLSGGSQAERGMWERFREMARNGNMEPRVVAPDWLLDVAMEQRVRFDKKFLVENFY